MSPGGILHNSQNLFIEEDYKQVKHTSDDAFKKYWSKIIPQPLESRFITAILTDRQPTVEARITSTDFIPCDLLKKLCFVYDRYDVGVKALPKGKFSPQVWLYLRSKTNKIITKRNLSDTYGFRIRGKIDIPDDVSEFRLEIILKLACNESLDYSYPAVIFGLSDMWLENIGNRPYTVYNLNESDELPPIELE